MAVDIAAAQGARKARRRRGPRRATAESLRKAALYYLDRYMTSAAHLRRLLLAKVERSARVHGTDREAGAAAVEALIAELARLGLLDDGRYAEAKAFSLHRRGASRRAIRRALTAKGIAAPTIARALARLEAENPEADLSAAVAFARRRRLGPYRPAEQRLAARTRDLAALGRQGFGYELARRVVEAADPAELEEEAADHARLS